jgi:hypothetical protein
MQRIILQRVQENALLAAAVVLYFAAVTLFSFLFTQS